MKGEKMHPVEIDRTETTPAQIAGSLLAMKRRLERALVYATKHEAGEVDESKFLYESLKAVTRVELAAETVEAAIYHREQLVEL